MCSVQPVQEGKIVDLYVGRDRTEPNRTETEIRKKSGSRLYRWSFGSVGPLGVGRFWVCDAQP